MKKNDKALFGIHFFILIFLIITLLFPLLKLLFQVEYKSFFHVVLSEQFKEALLNSLFTTSIATCISILLGILLAFTLNRTHIRRKGLWILLFTLPMLIPSISHGLGLINLFGTNGIINRFLGTKFNILGVYGIIIGSVIYSFPVAFLIFYDAYQYVDNKAYEIARVLGLNRWETFKVITFSALKRPIISATFAVFTMIFTDYGVPISVGARYNTLPVFLYREVIGLLDFSKGTIISLVLLIPAFLSFIFDIIIKETKYDANYEEQYRIKENKLRDIIFQTFAYILVCLECILFLSFIFIGFIKKFPYDYRFSFDHLIYVFSGTALVNIRNSLLISVGTAIIGTIVGYFAAYLTARFIPLGSKIIHILSMISLAIPGIVLGVSYSISFHNTFFYNTFIIIIIVNVIHFFTPPYLLAYNALGKLNQDYELVGLTCGIHPIKMIVRVIIPSTKDTLYEMFSYYFINSMITISAITFLFSLKTMPLSLLINQYEGQMMLEEAAIVSLIILIINILIKGIGYKIKAHSRRKNYDNK